MTFTKSLMLGSAAALVAVAGASAADLPSKKAAPAQYVKICDAAGAGYFYIPGSDTCLKISGYAELQIVGRTKALVTTNNPAFGLDAEVTFEAKTKTSYGDLYSKVAIEAPNGAGAAYLDRAYLQWAGITAGKYTTFMSTGMGGLYNGYNTPDNATYLLAYTFNAGPVAATLSLEDATQNLATFGGVNVAGATAQNGARLPNIVGNVTYSQGPITAALAAGYHQSNYAVGAVNKHISGYGVNGYISAKLGANDTVSAQAGWEQNALKFVSGGMFNAVTIDAIDGGKQSGYAVFGDYKHVWTPAVSTEIEASYGAFTFKTPAVFKLTQLAVGQVTKWSPVAGLTFGLETTYYRVKQTGVATDSHFQFQFRANRSF